MVAKTFTRPLEPVAATVTAVTLKNEEQPITGTRYAP
jgi:hypothetical protein